MGGLHFRMEARRIEYGDMKRSSWQIVGSYLFLSVAVYLAMWDWRLSDCPDGIARVVADALPGVWAGVHV